MIFEAPPVLPQKQEKFSFEDRILEPPKLVPYNKQSDYGLENHHAFYTPFSTISTKSTLAINTNFTLNSRVDLVLDSDSDSDSNYYSSKRLVTKNNDQDEDMLFKMDEDDIYLSMNQISCKI